MMNKNDTLPPPGEYIRDELDARGWTQEWFAHILGRPLSVVNQIITGAKSITPQSAKEIAAAFGTSAELWMNLESAYRLRLEESEPESVSRRAKLYDRAPVKDMIKRGWIRDTDDIDELETSVDSFLSEPLASAPKKSLSYGQTTPSQLAWLHRARQLARKLPVERTFERGIAEAMRDSLHALTTSEQEARHIPEVLGKMGIRFLVVENLPRTKIDGATLWLDESSPVIVVSLRYDRIDGFWHTLAHELSHVLSGDGKNAAPVLDTDLIGQSKIGTSDVSEQEQRADEEASDFLIPKAELNSFIVRHQPRFSKANINRFANLHQIHPGIIIGQLQHRNAIKYSHSRDMLVPVRSIVIDAALTDGWGHFPTPSSDGVCSPPLPAHRHEPRIIHRGLPGTPRHPQA